MGRTTTPDALRLRQVARLDAVDEAEQPTTRVERDHVQKNR